MNAAAIRNRLAGTWVYTIVRTSPIRAAKRGDKNWDSEEAKLAAKKNAPAALSESWKRRNSHNANSDCTTKPPPKESRLNSAAKRSTADREAASGCLDCPTAAA